MQSVTDEIALHLDEHGVYRVGGTRVTLDAVVKAFQRGATPEEIVQDYSSLSLRDVYQAIGYYLKHSTELAKYFESRQNAEANLLASNLEQWSPKCLRDRLLYRVSKLEERSAGISQLSVG